MLPSIVGTPTGDERSLQPVANSPSQPEDRVVAPQSGHSEFSTAALRLPLEQPLAPSLGILRLLKRDAEGRDQADCSCCAKWHTSGS